MKKIIHFIITIITLLLLIGNLSWATDYYVNKNCTNGITTYNPSTQQCTGGSATVYSSLANMNTALTGDQSDNNLYLTRGQRYDETLTISGNGTSGHPYTIGAHGTGANPLISGADTSTNWSHVIADSVSPFHLGEDFATNWWLKGYGATATAHTANDPVNGELLANTLTCSGVSYEQNNIYKETAVGDGSTSYTASIYAKKITGSSRFGINAGCTNYAVFSLTDGSLISQGDGNTGYSTTDMGNGWYRFSVTCVPPASTNTFSFTPVTDAGTTYGNTGSLYVFGHVLNTGTSPVAYTHYAEDLFAHYQNTYTTYAYENEELLDIVDWTTDLPTTYALMTEGSSSLYFMKNIRYAIPSDESHLWDGTMQISKRDNCINNNGKSYVYYNNIDCKNSDSLGVLIQGTSTGVNLAYVNVDDTGGGTSVNDTSTATFTHVIVTRSLNDGIDTEGAGGIDCWYCVARHSGQGNVINPAKGDGFSAHDTGYINQYFNISHDNYRSGRADTAGPSGIIYNSVFVNNGLTGSQDPTGIAILGSNYTLKNNIIANNGSGGRELSIVTGVTSDYNIIYNSNGGNLYLFNGVPYSWDGYKNASNQDANSLNVDPKLKSSTDFSLMSGSPAINNGYDLCSVYGTATDYAGKPVCSGGVFVGKGSIDIGAYEFQGGSGSPFPMGSGKNRKWRMMFN